MEEDSSSAALASVNAVFSQELLREVIFHHVIPCRSSTNNDRIAVDRIRSLRLVSRNWRQSVTKLLRKRKEPLFNIILNRRNSVSGTPYVQENGKVLDQFMNGVINSSSDEPIPTFTLKLMPEFFRRDNHKSLTNCLKLCGAGLIDIDLCAPANVCYLPTILSGQTLPSLKKLKISRYFSTDSRRWDGERSCNLTNLTQELLNGAGGLNEFCLFSLRDIPRNFELLVLPSTITTLRLDCPMTSVGLDLLLKNRLPNLSILLMEIPLDPLPDGILFRVLDNFKATLCELALMIEKLAVSFEGRVAPRTLLNLPVMEKLERLSVTSSHCELEPDLPSLENCLPQVSSMLFHAQTANMFRNWTKNSKFSSVHILNLDLIHGNGAYGHVNYGRRRSLDIEIIQQIHLAFPNVRNLSVHVSCRHNDSLKYIFKEMKNLSDLKISVGHTAYNLSSDFWDALLIGISPRVAAGLRTNPDWQDVKISDDNVPSIKWLKELKTLHLESAVSFVELNGELQPLISDLVFHFALLRMAKLTNLILGGRFQASAQMTETWRNEGRTLKSILPGYGLRTSY